MQKWGIAIVIRVIFQEILWRYCWDPKRFFATHFVRKDSQRSMTNILSQKNWQSTASETAFHFSWPAPRLRVRIIRGKFKLCYESLRASVRGQWVAADAIVSQLASYTYRKENNKNHKSLRKQNCIQNKSKRRKSPCWIHIIKLA